MSEDKAYDMWKELEAAKAEIDRLRAENDQLRSKLWIDYSGIKTENDRLRAEKAALHEAAEFVKSMRAICCCQSYRADAGRIYAKLAKTAKEGE